VATNDIGDKIGFERNRVIIEKYSREGVLLLRGGFLQQIEFIAQASVLRFSCQNGQFNIDRSVFLRIEQISTDRICIYCNDCLVRINGDNAAIEINAIVRIAKNTSLLRMLAIKDKIPRVRQPKIS
jgi:hypothetical protein